MLAPSWCPACWPSHHIVCLGCVCLFFNQDLLIPQNLKMSSQLHSKYWPSWYQVTWSYRSHAFGKLERERDPSECWYSLRNAVYCQTRRWLFAQGMTWIRLLWTHLQASRVKFSLHEIEFTAGAEKHHVIADTGQEHNVLLHKHLNGHRCCFSCWDTACFFQLSPQYVMFIS